MKLWKLAILWCLAQVVISIIAGKYDSIVHHISSVISFIGMIYILKMSTKIDV